MKVSPLYIAVVGVGLALAMGASGKSKSDIVDVKAGETWKIAYEMRGGKFSQPQIDNMTKVFTALGGTVISMTPNADNTTLTMVMKFGQNDKLPLNAFQSNPVNPNVTVGITAAEKISEPASTRGGVGNPADDACIARGGRLEVVNEPGGQRSYCILPDGSKYDSWALFRGEVGPAGK